MIFTYNLTSIGFTHSKNGAVCQDHSETYIDDNMIIVTSCDGHGGRIYIRSEKGSMYASKAIIDTFTSLGVNKIEELIKDDNLDKIKLEIICKWNELTEQDYSSNPFTIEELEKLTDEEKFRLEHKYVLAYGSTLNAAVLVNDYVICVQIGDGGIFLLKDDLLTIGIEENNENVANITYSLCGDSSYDNLYIKVYNKQDFDGIILCTDGLLTPYQSYANLQTSFVTPLLNSLKVINQKTVEKLDSFVNSLGQEIGTGDDVSLGLIYYK